MTIITKGMGAIIKKLGTISRNRASSKIFKKMKSGKSSRDERITHGIRDKTITSVPQSETVKKHGVKASVAKTKSDAYLKNIEALNKHKRAMTEGAEAKKKLKHMVDTKRAYKIGPTSIHPRDPGKKRQIGGD